MARVRIRAPKGAFIKVQTKWARWPGMIEAHRCGDHGIVIEVTSSWPAAGEKPDASDIVMTAHEAQAFAAWLSEQAEHLLAKESRRRAAAELRRIKKLEAKKNDD